MSLTLNYIYNYLRKEKILIDEKEFSFQVQSNPSFPSFLAIADALSFFKIPNGVFKLDQKELKNLPNNFVSVIQLATGEKLPLFVEKTHDTFIVHQDEGKQAMRLDSFQKVCTGIVLLVQKDASLDPKSSPKNQTLYWIFAVALFFSTFTLFKVPLSFGLFFLLPVLGILLTALVSKEIFKVKSDFLNNICEYKEITSCNAIVKSDASKIIKFSDLSLLYFALQVCSAIVFLPFGALDELFTMLKVTTLTSLPVLVYSIYLQKFVQKKWCPLCLAIATVIVVELCILLVLPFANVFSISSGVLFLFVFMLLALAWYAFKTVVVAKNKLEQSQMETNRLVRNYTLFKNTLIAKKRIEIYEKPFRLGNTNSTIKIVAILSPFCKPCESVFKLLLELLETYKNEIELDIIFKSSLDLNNTEITLFYRNLAHVYFAKGKEAFSVAMNDWFSHKDITLWNKTYAADFDETLLDLVYKEQNEWCLANAFNYTPKLFVNGYEFPSMYQHKDLGFFMEDLLDDKEL